jgi:hypothetical protein
MAEDKKGFLLYADLIHTIEKMPNDKAGELFKHILLYVNNKNPIAEDLIIELTFEPIKQQLKRDLIKFEKSKDEKSLNGRVGNLKRWNIDLYNKFISNKLTIEEAEEISLNRKTSLCDKTNRSQSQTFANIAVNDNVNVNVINNNNIVESIDYDYLLKYINKTLGRSLKVVNDKVKTKYKSLFKQGYTKAQIKEAIDNVKNNQYHKDSNYTYCTLEFFSRADTIDKYSSVTKIQDNEVIQDDYYLNIMKKLNQQ